MLNKLQMLTTALGQLGHDSATAGIWHEPNSAAEARLGVKLQPGIMPEIQKQ